MNINRRLEPLPEFETDYSERHELLLLAAVLIVGLTFATPALSLVSGVPALVFVAVVGAVYGALCVLLRRVLAGSLIGLLVTSTFAANVPLSSGVSVPGSLGPQLWLVQVPLVASVVLVLLAGPREVLAGATKSDGLFATFVGWTVLAALFGATARLDTALYFSLLMLQGLLVFALLRYAVQREILPFGLVARLFVGTVVAQSLFAVAQFLNGNVFGVTTLGEGDGIPVGVVSFGPLGEFAVGTHVAGFTGMSFHLASLIVLAVPIAVMLAIRESGWRRVAFGGAALVMTAVLRATGTDAGRGGLIVTLVLLGVALVYTNRTALLEVLSSRSAQTTTKNSRAANAILAAFTALASIVVLFYPSSSTGSRSSITAISSGPTTGGADGGASGGSGAGSAGGAANAQSAALESFLRDLSIPAFDISTLGGRLQQYVAGIDLFLQYPLFGVGGANFIYYSSRYGFAEDPLPIHSIYFALLAETGLPGLLLYTLLLGSVLWCGWTAAKRADNGLLFVGFLCGAVGYLAFGFWAITPLIMVPSFFPFWFLAGAIVGARRDAATVGV